MNNDNTERIEEWKRLDEAVGKEVSDLCHKRKDWTMHIPAQRTDSDLLITDYRLAVNAEITDLQSRLQVAEEALRWRRFGDSRPSVGQEVVVLIGGKQDWVKCTYRMESDFWHDGNIRCSLNDLWLPLPSIQEAQQGAEE